MAKFGASAAPPGSVPASGARTKILGLIGRGIGHTLSPLLHNAAMRELQIDGVYLPFDCSEGFPTAPFFAAMWDAGALGFNVTVPYKEAAAQLFAHAGLASVNTIYRGPSGWQAASTDGPGFLRGLTQLDINLQNFDAVIYLGNGGAALALCETLKTTVPQLRHCVLRRQPLRDELWQRLCPHSLELHAFSPLALQKAIQRYPRSLLLQTTSAPLAGDLLEPIAAALPLFPGVFIDLVYGRPSALLPRCAQLGIPHQDGIPMLVGQALMAEELWWGRSVAFDFLEALARQHLGKASP